jgi:hypothetical protein
MTRKSSLVFAILAAWTLWLWSRFGRANLKKTMCLPFISWRVARKGQKCKNGLGLAEEVF